MKITLKIKYIRSIYKSVKFFGKNSIPLQIYIIPFELI